MSITRTRVVLGLAAVAVLAAGCGSGQDVAGPDDGPDDQATATPSPAATGAVPGDLLDEAVATAVERTGVAAEDVQVLRAEDVQWSSSALGCPEEGQMYSQVVTDGYWIVLQAGDEELDLRAADGGPVRLCEGGGEPPMDSSGG